MKLIYVANSNVSVIESQVFTLLNSLNSNKKIDEIILLLGINKIKKINLDNKLDKNIKVKYFNIYPQYPLIEKFTIKSILKIIKTIKNIDEYVIHIRNEVLAYQFNKALLACKLGNEKILVDIRGAGYEQLKEYSKKNFIVMFLKKYQRDKVFKSLNSFKNISVVSKSLKEYIELKLIEFPGKINIVHCLASNSFYYDLQNRKKIRLELNIRDDEKLIVLSTGGDSLWQNTRETIKQLSQKNVKILNLSKNKINFKNVINLFVSYKNVSKYLSAADVAVIWRNNSITNKVALPVKFCEYILCGLPVISNSSIDFISNFIPNEKSGKIIKNINDVNNKLINKLVGMNRIQISQHGFKYFSVQSISKKYIKIYDNINKDDLL